MKIFYNARAINRKKKIPSRKSESIRTITPTAVSYEVIGSLKEISWTWTS
ncbi:MAG: hypothetical protein ACTSRG_21735 [Candidatus Helarchaeota archaeon]